MTDKTKKDIHYGGQAIIEGVMMRGKEYFAAACRRTNGEITTTAEPVEKGVLGSLKWLNRPFLRGTLALADAMVLGMKSLMWSANLAMQDEQARVEEKAGKTPSEGQSKNRVNDVALSVTIFISMALAILIFMFLPIFLTKLMLGGSTESRAWLGLTEGGIKLVFFFLYVWGISNWKEIRRIFEYHGAEHKTINAFEAGEELTVENVQKYTTVHVRCGTSFLLVVILVSILVFSAVPWQSALQRLGYKLVLLPFVAGIAYEIIKLAGSRKESRLMRLILGPGLLMQRITTQEPADDQVEVAIRSFQSVREAEERNGELHV
ncbi:MAG: DUF1385 domain-containing protein [Armatimonadetes bacterium]|nr:DUF1385 domain-containing protein [Armatimonadota bacterium]